MPRSKRNFKANRYYHLFNRGNRKQMVFYDDKDYQMFLDLIEYYSILHRVELKGYCIMPNHYHLLVKANCHGGDISKMMHGAMTKFGVYLNRKYNLVGRAFQGTYKHREINDEYDLANLKRYLRRNPVEAKMVSKGEYYRWLKV